MQPSPSSSAMPPAQSQLTNVAGAAGAAVLNISWSSRLHRS
jgi:hypothetical protein